MKSNAWAIVARREILAKLTDKSFLISTAITIAFVAAAVGFQIYQEGKETKYAVVTSSADGASMAEQVKKAAETRDDNLTMDVRQAASDDAAREQVRDGDADVWLTPRADGWQLTGADDVDEGLSQVMTTSLREATVARNAAAAGTSVAALERGSAVTTTLLERDPQQSGIAKAIGVALAILFYVASLTFGLAIATSVAEEKASRIVEIITSKISVNELLAGKVIGNLVLAFGQVALFVAVGLIGISFTKYSTFVPMISGSAGWFAAFFVAGFVLLACIWVVAGALVSRSEDLQSTSMPATMLTMLIFFAGLFAGGQLKVVLSFLPPFSMIVMPIRVIEGSAPWWQALLALVGLVVCAAVVVRLAARLYRRSLLQTQGRLSLKQAWQAQA